MITMPSSDNLRKNGYPGAKSKDGSGFQAGMPSIGGTNAATPNDEEGMRGKWSRCRRWRKRFERRTATMAYFCVSVIRCAALMTVALTNGINA